MPAPRAELRYVPCDLAGDDLAAELAAAGHGSDRATFWLMEGVAPYLPESILRGALSSMGERSADGSRLALTYVTRGMSQASATTQGVSAASSPASSPRSGPSPGPVSRASGSPSSA